MRFLFACGGTGGHINPALAVAHLIKEKQKDSEILFVGVSGGMEERLVPAAGFEIKTIAASSISRKHGLSAIKANLAAVKTAVTSRKASEKIIKDFSPDIVFGTGGYACFPTISAAIKLSIPTVVHEANAYPGLATRMLARRVSRVLLHFEASKEFLPSKVKCAVVGNPIRGDLLMYDREKAREELGIGEKPLLVSFWGSLGAREMNKKMVEFIKLEADNKENFVHIHASGKFGYEWMPEEIKKSGVELSEHKNIRLREYIDDMPRVLAAADLVMCRGGASTLSELLARGVPAIIVPSPNVTDNHQLKNAMELEKLGGAIVIEEKDVTSEKLYDEARSLLFDDGKRKEMSERLNSGAVLDAAERIYSEIKEIIKKQRG